MNSIIWEGILYDSTESLRLSTTGQRIVVDSSIIGSFESDRYVVKYNAQIGVDWKVNNFHIVFEVNGAINEIDGARNNDNWIINGRIDARFEDFCFIDISLSPFTNTLPVNNLNLPIGQGRNIGVIYVDILKGALRPVQQRYSRIADKTFRYESIPKDFQADIEVDHQGLVLFYPGLFKRVA